MYLQETLAALVRRWPVLLLGLIGIAVTGWATAHDVPTRYQSNGQLLVLLPPDATGSSTPTNPYLNAPGGLTTAASIVATEASTLDSHRRLAREGFGATYTVSVFPGAGPVVAVTAVGTDPAEVVATRDAVMALVTAELRETQRTSGAPVNQRMYVRQTSVDRGAEVLAGSKKRALIGTVGAGGLATLLACALLDRAQSAVVRRRGRTSSAPGQPAEPPTPVDPAAPSSRELVGTSR